MKNIRSSRAFTLIEVLIVVAILAVIAIVILPNFLSGSRQADVSGATQQIVSSLRLAQSQSAQQVQGIQWGVHFSNTTNTAPFYAVFSGPSYASGTVQNVYRLPASVAFASSTLPVGSTLDVSFSPISGNSPTPASIELYSISQPSVSSTISILATGEAITGLQARCSGVITGVEQGTGEPTAYSFTPSGVLPGFVLTNQTYNTWSANPQGDLPQYDPPLNATSANWMAYNSYNYASYATLSYPTIPMASASAQVGFPGQTITTTTQYLSLSQEWNAVNYVLNYPKGKNNNINAGVYDIQNVINQLLWPDTGVDYIDAPYPYGVDAYARPLYNEAVASGTAFTPGNGQDFVVMFVGQTPSSTDDTYDTMIVLVPVSGNPLLSCD